MASLRRPVAQLLLVAVVGSVFLPWLRTGSDASVAGNDLGEGRVAIIVCIITVVAIQFKLRPAWIGAGLAVAVTGRELAQASDVVGQSAAPGLWLATALGLAAAAMLVWDMVASLERAPTAG